LRLPSCRAFRFSAQSLLWCASRHCVAFRLSSVFCRNISFRNTTRTACYRSALWRTLGEDLNLAFGFLQSAYSVACFVSIRIVSCRVLRSVRSFAPSIGVLPRLTAPHDCSCSTTCFSLRLTFRLSAAVGFLFLSCRVFLPGELLSLSLNQYTRKLHLAAI